MDKIFCDCKEIDIGAEVRGALELHDGTSVLYVELI